MSWDKSRISALSVTEITNLMANARERGKDEIADLCQLILNEKPQRSSPKTRKAPSHPAKVLENTLSEKLIAVANELLATFDLSKESAKRLSQGTTRFIAHELLSANGKPKIGAHQSKDKRVVLDRYISYRVGDYASKLVCLLLREDDPQGVRFQVEGSPEYLVNDFKSPYELRPYLLDGEALRTSPGGEEFDTFEEAAERFKWLIGQIAPRKT